MTSILDADTVRAVSPRFLATEDGWLVVLDGSASPVSAYAAQLVEEGLARQALDGALVPWADIYKLTKLPAHASSVHLLQLPPTSRERPVLVSRGTPSDSDFRVAITGWRQAGGTVERIGRNGAVLGVGGQARLLSSTAFLLVESLEALASGKGRTSEERMILLGGILAHARSVNAELDSYLSRSDVLVARGIDLDLRHVTVGDVPVIEVIPQVSGAPDNWIVEFDKYDSTRARYDVSDTSGGMTHVLVPVPEREVLDAIKKLPGRRLGGRQAYSFIQNPYPMLGDDADAVLPPAAFEAAKERAGIRDWELDICPADETWEALLVDAMGSADGPYLGTVSLDEARQLLAQIERARESSDAVIQWRGHSIALSGLTLESVRRLTPASVAAALGSDAGAGWLDLAYYGDRVIGFEGQVVVVPKLQVPGAGKEWLPEELPPAAIDIVSPSTGTTRSVPMSAETQQMLLAAVTNAHVNGELTVHVPEVGDVPTEVVAGWLEAFKEATAQPPKSPSAPRDPLPANKLSLQILHNIEQLQYSPAVLHGPGDDHAVELPAALRRSIQLMPHQISGIAWMQARLRQKNIGVRGILLADDMGLGKTLQCLCLMAWYRQWAPAPRPCLVVAPVSLLENWKAEIEKFLDGRQGTTVTLYGEHLANYRLSPGQMDAEARAKGLKKALRPGFANGAAFVLTTYETLRDYQLSLAREQWGVLVCDEAQKIKTPGAMVTRAAKAMQADFKIACTGTPVENTLADLWCLFDFFQPGLLDSLSAFTKVFRQQIELRSEGHEAQVEVLRAQIQPWVLRRMKSDVAALHPKTEKPCEIPMSPQQQALYRGAIADFRAAVERDDGKGGAIMLGLLHRLRMICANPLAVAESDAEVLPVESHLEASPKLAWLLDGLTVIRDRGEKVIIFTEYREIQRLIQRAVAHRFGLVPSIVNGSTSVDPTMDASRQAIIDAFQAVPGFGVIVLSTTAVGFGVNIQAANHVIHFTRPWNPAKEDQATDRAYRIGQEREVFVYCPTIVGEGFESFEQRVAARLATKRELSADMLAPEQGIGIDDFAGI